MTPLQTALIKVVNRIPRGYVTNFGSIAPVVSGLTSKSISAQMIGWQLSGLPRHKRSLLPWWRVVAKSGYVSSLKLGDKGWKQIALLEKEGIVVKNNTVDMDIYQCGQDALRESDETEK